MVGSGCAALGGKASRTEPPEKVPYYSPPTDWGPSGGTIFSSLLTAGLSWLLIKVCVSPVGDEVGAFIFLLLLLALLTAGSLGSLTFSIREIDTTKGQFEPRQPELPPDWHNLYHPREKLTFYHNSVTKVSQWEYPDIPTLRDEPDVRLTSDELVGSYLADGTGQLFSALLKLPVTLLLYYAPLYELQWLFQLNANHTIGGWSFWMLASAFVALPQPLPILILALGGIPSVAPFFNGPFAVGWEISLSLALLGCLSLEVQSLIETLDEAARARLPPRKMTGDSTFLTDLICALCPGLGWRLHPFAFKLDFERIAIFPMPLKLPVPVPVPRWELLPGSLVALLFASPLVLPLAKVLSTPIEIPQAPEPSLFMDLFPIAKAATKGAQALEPGVFIEAVLSSPAVWVDVFVSVATVLIRKHKKAYESALEERKVESEKAVGVEGSNALFSVEVIEEKWKEDFDQRLGRKDD